jgi:hypothetical protein
LLMILFFIKTFQHFEIYLHNSIGVLKQLLFVMLINTDERSQKTLLFSAPVGNWYNKWCCGGALSIQMMASISPFGTHKVLFCLRFLFLTCFGTLFIIDLQKYA